MCNGMKWRREWKPPLTSSWTTFMSRVVSARIVGSIQNPPPDFGHFWPPVTTLAPSFLPVSMYPSTLSRCPAEMSGPNEVASSWG